MSNIANVGTAYICPMHASVRQSAPGKCPKCGKAFFQITLADFALVAAITGLHRRAWNRPV
jgi:heavy metal-binding protein